MEDGRRDRRLPFAAGVPQQLPRRGIVRVDALGRVDEQFVAVWSRHDHGRAVRHAAAPAIGQPALLARPAVEREQVRLRLVIAEQDQQIAVQRGRTAVAPARLERRVLDAEMPLPDDAAVHVERDDQSVAEPGVDPLPVGERASAWRGCVSRAAPRTDRPPRCDRPTARVPSRRANASTTRYVAASGPPAGGESARPPPIGCSRSASERSSRASRGCDPAATGVRPTWEVTITRSPQTMGDDAPRPASGAFQARFSVALHVVGRSVSLERP